MTGFGKREASIHGVTYVTEVKSINHRFREVVTRIPRHLAFAEEELKALVGKHCQRGRIEISLSQSTGPSVPRTLTINRGLAKRYCAMLRELQRECRIPGSIDVALLSGFRDIFQSVEMPEDYGKTVPVIKRMVNGALTDLDRMRALEGKALHKDISKRLHHVVKAQKTIRLRAPLVVRGLYERMRGRVAELLGHSEIDHGRLEQELAQFADRCDLSEELTRLDSHIQQMTGLLEIQEPVGRQMDFLLQEMGREVNTIGSKANDAEISSGIVYIKSELEKIREQVQNIE